MNSTFDLSTFHKIWSQDREYFFQQMLSWAMAIQVVIIVGAILRLTC